jgi:hypothetical protein
LGVWASGDDPLDVLQRELPVVKLPIERVDDGPDLGQLAALVLPLGEHGEDLAEQAPQLGALTHQESGRELLDAALPGLGEVDAGELGPLIGAHRVPAWRARMIRLAITAHVSGS